VRKGSDIILVTGATGNQGSATARQLLADGFRVRAMTHQPHSPRSALLAAAGAEVIFGNFDDPALLYNALDGVKAVFAVQDNRMVTTVREEGRGKRLAYLAKEQGVSQYIYSSVASAHAASGVPHFEVKGRIEQTIRDLKFDSYTFLRGAFFMESLLDTSLFPEVVSGKLISPIKPDIRVQLISAEDVAKFALYAFNHPDLMDGMELDLAGDEHTFVEIAEVLSEALKRKIEYAPMDIDEYVEMRGMSNNLKLNLERLNDYWQLVGWDIDIGGLMLASRNFGIDIKTLNEWANGIATKFGAPSMTAAAKVRS
jgi:uncharacterized protein YbjT (DUF2867 family)